MNKLHAITALVCLQLFLFPVLASAQSTESHTTESYGPEGLPIPLSSLGKAALGLQMLTVERKPLPITVETTGKIEAIPTWQFEQHSLVSGRIINILVKQGDQVKAKQPLLFLDSPEINQLSSETLKTKSELEYEIAETKALLDADIKQQQTKDELASAAAKRAEDLFKEGIASQRARQEAQAELQLADSRLKASSDKRAIVINALKTKLKILYNSLSHRLEQLGVDESRIRTMLVTDNTVLTVPVFSSRHGAVSQVLASVGQSIDPTTPLFKISDLSHVWATADIYEEDMSRMHSGQKVDLRVSAYPGELFTGTLTYIASAVDPAKRTLPVRAELTNMDLRLKPDMFAQLYIQTSEPVETILLPKEALVESTGHSLVFIETKEGYQATRVKTGRSLGDKVQILAGLKPGDRVVVEGAFQLDAQVLKSAGKDDMFVQPTEGERIISHDTGHEKINENGEGQTFPALLAAIAVVISFLFGMLAMSLAKRSAKERQSGLSKQLNDSERISKG